MTLCDGTTTEDDDDDPATCCLVPYAIKVSEPHTAAPMIGCAGGSEKGARSVEMEEEVGSSVVGSCCAPVEVEKDADDGSFCISPA